MTHDISYPPLNTPKPVAKGVWIVDAAPVHAGGLELPIRMTVLRLAGGELLLHSPVPHDPGLQRALEGLGRIGHLVAPSIGHWMFLAGWQAACPNAITWAVPGLEDRRPVRRAGIRIDGELGDRPPRAWGGAIDTVLVAGPVFREVCLFHRPSGTLVLTDLVVNLEADLLPLGPRALARLLGIVAPDGRAPLYLRLLLSLSRAEAARAAQRLIDFAPDRVLFAHGQWFARDATNKLRRALAWLLAPESGAERLIGPRRSGLAPWLAGAALAAMVAAIAYARRR
ncbi:DUF4336 domain-containing protein [Methylobacterium sp. J-078]|uniref:DUF4336 domain-containing protein n=1 Tax=Methylobacterium sp. J-078 TaxID=2836657 RepID=UPI001FB921F8|nr:DUF4336 domain-containing protein [Methylobacterium sp. J-078]MCJ2046423.1 DUF4336 domain-containing protein [Methylobacterium sp. J-078]